MSKTQEALKLALEALKGGLWDYGPGQDEHQRCNEVIAICEAALADGALDRMAENARELGLDYEPPCKTGSQCTSKCQQCEQPAQQEPVAGVVIREGLPTLLQDRHIKPTDQRLYTSPQPRKPWVGLTDEEYSSLHDGLYQQGKSLGWVVDQIETKLREKNA